MHDIPASIAAIHDELGIARGVILARALPFCAEAAELVDVQVDADGRVHRLAPPAAQAWRAMRAAADADGVRMELASAFRSVARQVELIRAKLDRGVPIAEILVASAPPGFSEHHTGLAVDIAENAADELEEIFEATPAFAWLTRHAARFGFSMSYPRGNAQGYLYEPWHWCWRDTTLIPLP